MIKYAAVVLTFNRPNLLKENIDSVLEQECLPEELFIVDNHSTDNTEELVNNYLNNKTVKISYIKLDRNYGSAGGFYYAIKTAYDAGYDYILTMDDDGKPYYKNTFRRLLVALEEAVKKNKKIIIGPLVTYDGTNTTFGPDYPEGYIESIKEEERPILKEYISPYNGTIISRACIDCIGLPNKDFFLYGDEIDYMMRAKKNGVMLLTVINSIYQHPKANEKMNAFLKWHIVSYEGASDRKQYYYIRNHYYALKSNGETKLATRLLLNRIISIAFYEKDKKHKMNILKMAIRDVKRNNIYERANI